MFLQEYIFMCIDLYDYLIYISMELIMEYYYFWFVTVGAVFKNTTEL